MQTLSPTPARAGVCTVPLGAVLLPPALKFTTHEYHDGRAFRTLKSSDGLGNEIRLQTPTQPESRWEKPGAWYGQEVRVDSLGRKWARSLGGDYVVNDFGDLVEATPS